MENREQLALEAIEGEIDYERGLNHKPSLVAMKVLEKMKALGYTRQPEPSQNRVEAVKNWQLVWWWERPNFKFWHFPESYKQHEALKGKPMFYGLYLGIVEIRYFPISPRG